MSYIRSLAVLVAVAVWATPVAAQSRQEQQMAASLLMIQEQQQQLALGLAQLTEVVKAITPRFDEVIEAQRKRLAEMEALLKVQGGDLKAVLSQTQDTGTRIGSLQDEIEALRQTVDQLGERILQLQLQPPPAVVDPNAPAGETSQAPAVLPTPVVTPPPAQTLNLGTSPTRMLSEARGDYHAGRFSLAISGFEGVIRNFPGTQTAADAQFLIGESHSGDDPPRWPQAIAAYNAVIQNYPKSSVVPDAYYGRAIAEARAGDAVAARATLELLAKTYPDSNSGQLALQRLKAQPPPPGP